MKKLLEYFILGAACGFLACFALDAEAEPIIGQDFLATMQENFKVVEAVKYLQKGQAVGVLDWTFGNRLEKVKKLLEAKPPYLRAHLINNCCIRNRNCGAYEIGYGYSLQSFEAAVLRREPKIIDFLKERTRVYRDLSGQYPATRFLLSPALEHNLGRPAFRVLADAVLEVFGNVQLVNNPVSSGGERYRDAWLEGHGQAFDPSVEITSLDGDDGFDIKISDWKARAKNTKIAFFWWKGLNCRTNSAVWEDPRARTHCPKPEDFEAGSHITDVKPKPPRFTGVQCKRMQPFDAPSTNKPMAENKATGDSRADKPVVLVKFNLIDIKVLSSKGQLVGILGAYGAYQNGLNRFYSGFKNGSRLTGYEFEKIAMEKSGSPWVWLQSKNQCTGPLLVGRRQGTFR